MPQTAQDWLLNPDTSGQVPLLGSSLEEQKVFYAAKKVKKDMEQNEFVRRNQLADVPLDTTTGLDSWTRFKMGFVAGSDINKQANYLTDQGMTVRKTDDGSNLIITTTDASGKAKDVLANEFGVSMGDVAALGGHAIPMAALMTVNPEAGIGRQMFQAGARSFIAGAGQDMISRSLAGEPIDPGQIASERGKEALLNTAGTAIFGLVGKIASPFANKGYASARVAEALENIQKETGIPLQLSAGEKTGSMFLQRSESYSENMPGSSALKALKVQQDEDIRKIQDWIVGQTGGKDVGTDDVAARAAGLLGAKYKGMTEAAGKLRGTATTESTQFINGLLDRLSLGNTNLSASETGDLIRARLAVMRDTFEEQAKTKYGEVAAKLGPDDHIVPQGPIQDYIDSLKPRVSKASEELAPAIKTVMTATKKLSTTAGEEAPQILDQFGRIMQQDAINGNLSLQKVREFRSLLGQKLASGDPVVPLPDSYRSGLYKALSQAIDDGVQNANPEAATLLKQANEWYKTGISKFEQKGVSEAFRTAQDAGFKSSEDLANQVFSDIDQLRRYKDMLGANSPEYQTLIRNGFNGLIRKATPITDQYIDGGSLLRTLKGFSDKNPEVWKDVMGPSGIDLVNNAELLKAAQGGKINADVLQNILSGSPRSAAKNIQAALDLEKARDEFFNTKIIRDLLDGQMAPAQLNPEEFVARFINQATPQDASKVVSVLSQDPQALADVQRKTIESLLNQSRRPIQSSDIFSTQAGEGAVPVDAKKMFSQLTSRNRVYEEVLGKDTMGFLNDYLSVEAARTQKSEIGALAGQLAAGNVMQHVMKLNLNVLPDILQYKVEAALLASKGLRNWFSNTADLGSMTPDAIQRLIFASPEVARALHQDFSAGPSDVYNGVIDLFHNLANRKNKTESSNISEKTKNQVPSANTARQFLTSPISTPTTDSP